MIKSELKQLIKEQIKHILFELNSKDIQRFTADGFLNMKFKSDRTPGVSYRNITKDGMIHFTTPSHETTGVVYDQYVKLVDLERFVKEFSGKLQPIEIVRKTLAGDILLDCTDPSWLYWGFKYKATKNNYSIDPETRAPVKRNPNLKGGTCKHLESVLRILNFLAAKITSDLQHQGVFNNPLGDSSMTTRALSKASGRKGNFKIEGE